MPDLPQIEKRLSVKGGTKEIILGTLAGWITKIITLTMRCQIHDPHQVSLMKEPFILCFWHGGLLPSTLAWDKLHFRPRDLACLTSSSKDGAIIASFMRVFQISSVRGSSSRRGVTALLELKKAIAAGLDVAITPDGPRGPAGHFQAGAIKLAQLTGSPIVLLTVECSRAWRLSTWDSFCIPRPFSSIHIHLHAPIPVPRRADDATIQSICENCQNILSQSPQPQ